MALFLCVLLFVVFLSSCLTSCIIPLHHYSSTWSGAIKLYVIWLYVELLSHIAHPRSHVTWRTMRCCANLCRYNATLAGCMMHDVERHNVWSLHFVILPLVHFAFASDVALSYLFCIMCGILHFVICHASCSQVLFSYRSFHCARVGYATLGQLGSAACSLFHVPLFLHVFVSCFAVPCVIQLAEPL
jgi:hypothetical protein